MSMELFVLLALNRAPGVDAWQQALRKQRIPAQFTEEVDLDSHDGFLPIVVRGEETGLYFHKDSYTELSSRFASLTNLKIKQPIVYVLGYGGHFYECAAAFYAAAALVAEFDAKAFEPQAGVFMNRQELMEAGDLCMRSATTDAD